MIEFVTMNTDSIFYGCPKTVKIGPYRYTIEQMSPDAADLAGLYGCAIPGQSRILLAEGTSPEMLADTALHEIIHAINQSRGVGDGAKEEVFTSQASTGLCEFWQNNPEFVSWWEVLLCG